jgi:hypothetical protein
MFLYLLRYILFPILTDSFDELIYCNSSCFYFFMILKKSFRMAVSEKHPPYSIVVV